MHDLSWLLSRFEEARQKNFMIWGGAEYTYSWLLDRIDIWRKRLARELAYENGITAIEGDYSPDVVAALLALIERGDIAVPLTDSVEHQKPEFFEIAEVQSTLVFRGSDATVRATGREPRNDFNVRLLKSKKPGLVLFSSGSTGKSKAALHDFSFLLEKFKVRRHVFVTLTFLLLDHIGGVNTLLYILSNAGTIVAVLSRNPDDVCEAIEKYAVELLPTSPTFLNLLLISEAHKRHDLSSLKRMTYGTEAMPLRTLERVNELFPNVQLQQTYGLSELGIMRTKSRSNDSLWVKVGGEGFETRIVDGTLHIRAQSAMLGYLNAPSPYDADGWFNTGDQVEVDGEYIKILGRRSEMVNVGGLKVYPAEVESVLLGMSNVQDVSVTGQPHPITGNIVVATFTLLQDETVSSLRSRTRQYCKGKLEPYKIPALVKITSAEQHGGRFKKMRRVVAETADIG